MTNASRLWIGCFVAAIVLPNVTPAHAQSQEKLAAFAKTYGYVRFFHPSDQASLLDWNQMAIFGANEVLASPEDESTSDLLTRIFSPVVVDLEFYKGAARPRPATKKVAPTEILAWQHLGVGLGGAGNGRPSLYRSARTNRSQSDAESSAPFANVLQAMDANELRGKEIRFSFHAKVDQKPCRLQGWIQVDRESEEPGLNDDMEDRPITKTEWARYELGGTVDDDAELITFGVMMFGKGSGLIDDAKLELKDGDDWSELEISNADFEEGDASPDGWIGAAKGFDYISENEDVAEGEQAMRVRVPSSRQVANVGFIDVLPEFGEVVDAEVCEGLRIRMPLTLAADKVYNLGDDSKTDAFIDKVAKFSKDEDPKVLAVGNVVITWSVFQHFYPYFDQIETDWDTVLDRSMKSASEASGREDVTKCIEWLVARLDDGHGRVLDPVSMRGMKFLPIALQWVEGKLVVVASDDERIHLGDVVTHVDDVNATKRILNDEEFISGSPQWKRFRSTDGISMVLDDRNVTLRLKQDGAETEVELVPRTERPPMPKKLDVISTLVKGDDDGTGAVFYVDLGRAEPGDVDPMIDQFANAKGIVFDMRGYPRGTQYLFQHMTDQHMQSAKWLVAKQVRPDRVDKSDFDKRGRWEMPPRTPRFKGKFVFITNGSAISYAESCMAIVANYQLGEIIGSPTAGANGNINPFQLAGGYRVVYTGMRVVNHDDSQHHVLGVKPTIPMEPTIQAIRDGKDELLDKALEILK